MSRLEALQLALGARIGSRAASWVLRDARNVVAIGSWLRRRGARQGGGRYPYDGQFRVLMAVAALLTVLEGCVVDGFLLVSVRGWVAWTVLGVHLYALYLVVAARASWRVHLHVLRGEELVLRQGAFRATVPLRDIERLVAVRRDGEHAMRWHSVGDGAFELPVSRETNLTARLRPGASVAVLGSLEPATLIHFYADDPSSVAAAFSALSPH